MGGRVAAREQRRRGRGCLPACPQSALARRGAQCRHPRGRHPPTHPPTHLDVYTAVARGDGSVAPHAAPGGTLPHSLAAGAVGVHVLPDGRGEGAPYRPAHPLTAKAPPPHTHTHTHTHGARTPRWPSARRRRWGQPPPLGPGCLPPFTAAPLPSRSTLISGGCGCAGAGAGAGRRCN